MKSDPIISNLKRLSPKLRLAAAAMLVLAAGAMALSAASSSADNTPRKSQNGVYIVQMKDAPAVAYKGGVAGHKATAPKKGEKINPLAPDVVKYVGYLKNKHDEALRKVGNGQKIYSYAFSYNGFAAKLTDSQAALLAKQDGVLAVSADELMHADTSTTASFLGLDAANGLWAQLGGVGDKKTSGAGEGMVIGVIDSGIWPESASFSDRDASGKLVFQQIPGFHGKCESNGNVGDGSWNANLCNQKLIAARHYNSGWGGDAGIAAQFPWEFLSPRDYNGHGTHTTSTAGGNNAVQIPSTALNLTGMAPRARVAMYKALWHQPSGTASGFSSDLAAAIDQAVADGVDVINYSVSGSITNFLHPAEVAFLTATEAGIFVATSSGNSGPAVSTVAHPAPWTTTVAAANHPGHNGTSTVVLGNNATYTGASFASPLGPAPVVLASASGLPGADPDLLRQCFSNPVVLDPAKIAGKIVVCERGGFTPPPLAANARVDKSFAVQQGGGVGMILVNVTVNNIVSDIHAVPSIHLNDVDGAAVKTYVTSAGAAATAKINQATISSPNVAPVTASFSSRGPSLAAGGDVLKPDVIAPGVDVLAAVAPTANNGGQNFASYQGTSMSSPHVAGVAALLKQLRPSWTPMMIKSALMTTAYDVLDGGTPAPNTNPVLIFRQGAGHIAPNTAANPGLVFNSDINDWLAFLCGTTTAVDPATCTALAGAGYSFDASDMNTASIAIGDMAGAQTVKRRVTNVGNSAATYTSAVTGMTGITTVVSPASLTLNPGQTGTFTVTFTRAGATLNNYVGGQLTWTGGGHTVRIPMVVRPVSLTAPTQVSGNGTPIVYNVKFGFSGPFTADPRGVVPAITNAGSVATNASQSFNVVVPAGTTYARFSLFDQPGISDDLDLEVYNGATLVGSSGGSTAAEEVNLLNPAAATYTVKVIGFATQNPTANFTLYSWVLGSTAAGNMSVSAPATATTGVTAPITLSFTGLSPATKYLGSVVYGGSPLLPNPTIVRVDTP